MVQAIRATLRKVPDAAIRVRDLSRPGALAGCGYPIHLAVSGPEADKVRDLAQRLAQEMQSDKKLTDVRASRESEPRSYSHLVVDRLKAQELGVAMLDIFDTLQVWVGGVQVSDFNLFGRNWQVVVQVDERLRKRLDDLTNIKVRDKQGKLIPLSRVAAVETGRAPAAVVRLDQKPMVAITANLGAEATPAQARTVCETQFERLLRDSRLGAEYRLTWLEELPTPK
jgi:multidrug efflux pump subunit AcrB